MFINNILFNSFNYLIKCYDIINLIFKKFNILIESTILIYIIFYNILYIIIIFIISNNRWN